MVKQVRSLLVTSIAIPAVVANGGKKSNSLMSVGATSGGWPGAQGSKLAT
jgi:hypothetical protein